MGVSLWGESAMYENRKVFITMDTTKSTSRRQGLLREEGFEANSRGFKPKPEGKRASPESFRD